MKAIHEVSRIERGIEETRTALENMKRNVFNRKSEEGAQLLGGLELLEERRRELGHLLEIFKRVRSDSPELGRAIWKKINRARKVLQESVWSLSLVCL